MMGFGHQRCETLKAAISPSQRTFGRYCAPQHTVAVCASSMLWMHRFSIIVGTTYSFGPRQAPWCDRGRWEIKVPHEKLNWPNLIWAAWATFWRFSPPIQWFLGCSSLGSQTISVAEHRNTRQWVYSLSNAADWVELVGRMAPVMAFTFRFGVQDLLAGLVLQISFS